MLRTTCIIALALSSTSALPPAPAMRSFARAALALKRWAWTVSALVRSPFPRIFTPSRTRFTIPRFTRTSGVTIVPSSKTSRRPRFTSANSLRKGVGEAALGHPAVQGHLAALEAHLSRVAAAALLPVLAAARGLAGAAARAATHALPLANAAPGRLEIVKAHFFSPLECLSTRPPHQVRDLVDHAPDHGGVLALHDLLEPPQAQPANGGPLAFGQPMTLPIILILTVPAVPVAFLLAFAIAAS